MGREAVAQRSHSLFLYSGIFGKSILEEMAIDSREKQNKNLSVV